MSYIRFARKGQIQFFFSKGIFLLESASLPFGLTKKGGQGLPFLLQKFILLRYYKTTGIKTFVCFHYDGIEAFL
jgi:hypothetical protein